MTYAQKEAEKAAARQAWLQRSDALSRIINPLPDALYGVDYSWGDLQYGLDRYAKDYGGVDLTPDFQRGHVWTPSQQQHFIENVLRGAVPPSGLQLQLNCPNWDNYDYAGELPRGMQCIDGLQRITAIQRFLAGEVRPFGLGVDDLNNSRYSMQGSRYLVRVVIYAFQDRASLLRHYLAINGGGTAHSEAELARVATLLNEAQGEK